MKGLLKMMMMTMMMEMIVIVRVSELSTTMVVHGEVRGGRVPVEPVVLTMRGEDGVETDGRVPVLLVSILRGLATLAISIDATRVLLRRLSRKAGA